MTNDAQKYANDFAAEIKRFQAFINLDHSADTQELKALCQMLSSLLAFGEAIPDVQFEKDDDAPELNRDALEIKLRSRFPNLGFYNSCYPGDEPIGAITTDVSDGLDDLLDIYHDLSETLWHIDNDAPALGLFEAKTLFFHWGRHAINLKSYLHQLVFENSI